MAMRHPTLTPFLLLLAIGPLPCQGTPWKGEVDGLIRFFRKTAHANRALGAGTCRHTAMVLTAMGHCHRFYTSEDGPVVRGPVNFLFSCRRADGSFADKADKTEADAATTTGWVLAALRILDPDANEDELDAGATWLKRRGNDHLGFRNLHTSTDDAQKIARSIARGPIARDGKPDMDANVRALLALVRAQMRKRDGKPAVIARPTWTASQQNGVDFLLTKQDGGKFFMMIPTPKVEFMKHYDLGLTGMGIAALQTKPASLRTKAEQSVIDKGLAWILENQNPRGSFGTRTVNYTTCAAVMAIAKAKRPEFKVSLQKAQHYIVGIQNTEHGGYHPSDRDYGSIGYGGDERGDLSNTQFAIQALKETELDAQDEVFAKAIRFLQRTQNVKGSFKATVRDTDGKVTGAVISGNDGGSAYYPGNSPAGYFELPDGTKIPRSYGSMTYALLKTYTLCGVERDDPRVVAAVRWIQNNFDLDINPGSDPEMPEKAKYQGLYYYYMVMAQALDVVGIEMVKVTKGKDTVEEVAWRKALRDKLTALQNKNGGWLNSRNGRWFEQLDLVCTTYAMLALERCK